jgi:hypothetical protein
MRAFALLDCFEERVVTKVIHDFSETIEQGA